jgi:copper chaperone CopZ
VTSGFKGYREINTVTYDKSVVSPEEMVSAIKNAGTYRGLVED